MKIKKSILSLLVFVTIALVTPFLSIDASATEPTDENMELPATIVYAHETAYSEKTPCQVNCKAIIPDGFELNCVISILRWDTEDDSNEYKVNLYSINDYSSRIYLAEGTYSVWGQIADDNTSQYALDFPSQIEVKADEVFLLEATLSNYKALAADISTRIESKQPLCSICGSILNDSGICTNTNCRSNNTEAQSPIKTVDSKAVFLEHIGHGDARIYSTGTQISEYRIVVEIIKTGQPSEATYKISLDDGKTFSEETILPLSGVVPLPNTGLELTFLGTFEEGDIYTKWFRDPAKKVSVKYTGDSNATIELLPIDENAYTYDILYANKYTFSLKINREGSLGEAVFSYSLDGQDYSEEMYVPKIGVYTIEEAGLKIIFNSNNKTPYIRGDIYSISINYPSENDYTSLYIMVCFVVIAFFTCIMVLSSKQKKDSEYNLQRWKLPEE